ncbi:MAG: hypothetical protein AB7P40_00435 [Chloroflexota bacterium]
MADSPWQYSRAARRFRDTRSGRFLAFSKAVDLRDGFQERRQADVAALTRRLANEDISVQQWEAEMTQAVRETFSAQYALGRGGLNAMTAADWLAADDLVQAQRQYLRGFAQDIAAGKLSAAQITARAKLYYGASTAAYERGRAAAWGVRPPHVPGDGSTPCLSQCKCYLTYVDKPDEVHVTWHRTASESCSVCKSRARTWRPLVIAKTAGRHVARLYRAVA